MKTHKLKMLSHIHTFSPAFWRNGCFCVFPRIMPRLCFFFLIPHSFVCSETQYHKVILFSHVFKFFSFPLPVSFQSKSVFKSSLTSTIASPGYYHTFIFSNITKLPENKVCPGFLQFPPLHLLTVIGFYIIFPLILLKKTSLFNVQEYLFNSISNTLCYFEKTNQISLDILSSSCVKQI